MSAAWTLIITIVGVIAENIYLRRKLRQPRD